jgi:hypothetical protein
VSLLATSIARHSRVNSFTTASRQHPDRPTIGGAIRDLVDLAMEHGPDAMAAAFATLMNHAMQIKREQVLKAESPSELIVKATPTVSNPRR